VALKNFALTFKPKARTTNRRIAGMQESRFHRQLRKVKAAPRRKRLDIVMRTIRKSERRKYPIDVDIAHRKKAENRPTSFA
jgi:hypothetical protein